MRLVLKQLYAGRRGQVSFFLEFSSDKIYPRAEASRRRGYISFEEKEDSKFLQAEKSNYRMQDHFWHCVYSVWLDGLCNGWNNEE